jgi:chemotaxis protein histidine kinase CheA
VTQAASRFGADERLLTFDVGGGVWALPISGVLEVAEVADLSCIPMLPRSVGGAMNYHGDALPVLRRSSLLDVDESVLPEPQQVLVITDARTDVARFGLPVDRVVGLVDGVYPSSPSLDSQTVRRTIDGRVATLIDPQQLVARAREVIESSVGRAD